MKIPTRPPPDGLGVAWAVGALSTGLVVLWGLGLSWHRRQLDIAVYLMGGRGLVDGQLYLVALPHPPHLPFTYPPFAALVFAPLRLSRRVGPRWSGAWSTWWPCSPWWGCRSGPSVPASDASGCSGGPWC